MKKSNYLPLIFTIIGLLTITTSFSQSNTKNIYLINPVCHNTKLIDTDEKLKTITQSIKYDILKNDNFIFISKVSKGRFILVSNHNQKLNVRDIQKFFTPYSFGVKIIALKEVNQSEIDLSSIPIDTNQKIDVFNDKLNAWETTHSKTIQQLKDLFNK